MSRWDNNNTFDLPNGAKLIYTGIEVKNQAFRFKKAIGLQFHLEMKYELIEKWLAEVTESEREKILTDSGRYLNDLNKMCKKLIENFLKL